MTRFLIYLIALLILILPLSAIEAKGKIHRGYIVDKEYKKFTELLKSAKKKGIVQLRKSLINGSKYEKFSFYDDVGTANLERRKEVYKSWVLWWEKNKEMIKQKW